MGLHQTTFLHTRAKYWRHPNSAPKYRDGKNKRNGKEKSRRKGRGGKKKRKTLVEVEAREESLKGDNPEQQLTDMVELPTTEPRRDPEVAPEAKTSRKRRTRSSTLIDLSNAAREMARANTSDNTNVEIVDITDGWETPIPQRKEPKKEKEHAPSMVEFGREMRPEVDYIAAMQRVQIFPSANLDKRTVKKLGIEKNVAHCLQRMEIAKFVRKIGKTYEIPTREFLSTAILKYPSTTLFDATTGVLEFSFERKPYAIKVIEIRNLFGFSHDKETSYERKTKHQAKLTDITGEKFGGGPCKVARVQHPAIRYVQHLRSCSLFGRTDANTITLEELYMMLRPFFEEIPRMNLGTLLAQNLTGVKHYAHSKKETRTRV